MDCNLNCLPRLVLISGMMATTVMWPSTALAQSWFSPAPEVTPGPTGPPPSAEIGDLLTRIDRLEQVVRRLNSEVESLRRRLGEDTEASTPPAPRPQAPKRPMRVSNEIQPQMLTEEGAESPRTVRAAGPPTPLLPLPPPAVVSTATSSAGAAQEGAVEPAAPSAIENIAAPARSALLRGPQPGSEVEVAALPPRPAESQAHTAYSQAYGRLIAEDMDGAGAAFTSFLKRFPGHELAGNAQYWLAETHFVRGQYAHAAREFLTGYKTYGSSPKAPESLLKLGLSLVALGRADEACSSLREVAVRFPQAPSAVHERAAQEQINAGC